MAKLLTKSFQEIDNSKAYYSGTHIGYLRLYAKYDSQSVANNKTYGSAKLTFELIAPYNDVSSNGVSSNLLGQNNPIGYKKFYRGEIVLQEGDFEINHNNDGTSREKGVQGGMDANVISGSSSGITGIGVGWTVTAPKIDRYPMLTNAPDFRDTESPTITFTTTLGFEGATVKAVIAKVDGTLFVDDNDNPIINWQTIDNLALGTYTFELTSTQREALQKATPNSNTLPVKFILRTTTTGGVNYDSELTRDMAIVNANPTATYPYVENNSKVVTVLGGNTADIFIQNASKILFSITPTLVKYAGSITSIVATNGGETYNAVLSSGVYVVEVPIQANTINIVITDSRGNFTIYEVKREGTNYVEYTPIDLKTFSLERVNPTSSEIILNITDSVYSNIDFKQNVHNVPTVKWQLDDGSEITIPSNKYNISSGKLLISNYTLEENPTDPNPITNVLPYTDNGTFSITISDSLTSDSDTQTVMKGVATFEAGEHDFQVNGDLIIADENRQNGVNVLEAINKIDVYTTTERVVGTWINDETLYRKVVNFSNVGTSKKEVAHNISNIDTIVKFDAIGVTSSGASYRLPMLGGNGMFGSGVEITTRVNKTNIEIQSTNAYDHTFYYIIYYTKTS